MIALIISIIVVFLIFASFGKKKTPQRKGRFTDTRTKSEEQKNAEFYPSIPKNTKIINANSSSSKIYYNDSIINVGAPSNKLNQNRTHNDKDSSTRMEISSTSTNNSNDESIIDITDQISRIDSNVGLKTYSKGVPKWPHHYVYSYNEIGTASNEQKNFYNIFKSKFISGEYLDLEGNTNYAFILLFDILNEYESHKDISKLERLLKVLAQFYPKTKSYGVSFLIQKMGAKEDNTSIVRLREEETSNFQNYNADYDYWRIGSRYKTKLKLDDEQVRLVNNLWNPGNNFCSIEFCLLEIIKLYLLVIDGLKQKYKKEGTTLNEVFMSVADVIARKQYRYKNGTQNYKFCIETTTKEIYIHIFKNCENAVREFYNHKRKINTEVTYTSVEAKNEFISKITSSVVGLLPSLITKVAQPDEATDIELYAQNTSRWKLKFKELTLTNKDNPKAFVDSIITLGRLNKKNPSLENIFFEAFKYLALHNKESALSLYIHYLHHDLNSTTFDNKQPPKTILKTLFKTSEQQNDFEIIVNDFIRDRDLDKALMDISKIYEIKRRKIKLDINSIKEVEQQHSGTVELLNEYLQDDEEIRTAETIETYKEAFQDKATGTSNTDVRSTYRSDFTFTDVQKTVLELFAKNNYSISESELEIFAKSNGVFKNQLVDSINEICYDFVDDIIIEQEDEFYTLNANYHQILYAK